LNKKIQASTDFKKIFEPSSIAVVGAGTKGFGFGRGILLSLIKIGYSGKLFPVNPKGGELNGLRIYEKIEDIPQEIDFAIIAVPASRVPEALEACRKKGAEGAEILTSGFDELDTREGIELNEKLKEIASKGIRIIGPNCFGIYNPESGLTLLPGPDLSREKGNNAFISQSGGMSIDYAFLGLWKGLKFSKIVSYGNGVDLREAELLRYFGNDPETGIISMYLEGIEDGKSFIKVLEKVSQKKPVIIMKGGLSRAGQRAVQSHTASLGGKRIIWESVFRQYNTVQVSSLKEMSDTALAFSTIPGKTYMGISIVGGGGALGVTSVDAAESFGMIVPELSKDIQKKIKKVLPGPGSSAENPVDFGNPFAGPEIIKETLTAAGEDKNIDLQVLVLMLYHYESLSILTGRGSIDVVTPVKEIVDAVDSAALKTSKPVLVVLPNYKKQLESMDVEILIRKARKRFLDRGIPVFEEVDDALRAVKNLSRYYKKTKR